MAFDMKNVQVWANEVTELFVANVKKHVIISLGVLSVLFLLYIFFRSLFFFLVFAIPIFIFIGFAFRLIYRIHQENLRKAKGDVPSSTRKLTPSTGGRNLDQRGSLYAHAQSVRRRNSKKYENHVHFQEGPDEKDIIFSTRDSYAMVEETPKEIKEVEVASITDRSTVEHGDGSGLRPSRYSNERLGVESVNSDDDEDEEEVPGEGNKAVEWSEDDQKNLMDLGFSEMERNKRLESLIAKRRARKLLSLQVRKSLMNIGRSEPSGEMASFLIPKMARIKLDDMSPTPGSAPSVLLPMHNPFDIPYDPQEEKPNLTGGFQEELVEPHYNDAVLRRHESFSLGASSQKPWDYEQKQDESSLRPDVVSRPKCHEIPEFSRFKNQFGKEDLNEHTETKSSQQSSTIPSTNSSLDSTQQYKDSEKALNDVHIVDGTKKVKDVFPKVDTTNDIHGSGSSSSSEIFPPFSAANRDDILRSLSFSVRKHASDSELDTHVRKDEFFYNENHPPFDYKGMYGRHTPSLSIASDMLVEVSEAGSQITNLSSDGGSPKYDVGADLEGKSGNLDAWVASPQLKKVEENEARMKEVQEVSEQDLIKVGFSRIDQEIKEPLTNHSRESSDQNLALPVLESAQKSTAGSESALLNKNILPNPKEPSNSVENTGKEEKVIDGVDEKVELVNDDHGIIKFIQHTYGEKAVLMNDTNRVDVLEGNNKQPENNNSKEESQATGLNFTGNNIRVKEGLNENDPSKTNSSTSSRTVKKTKSFKLKLAELRSQNKLGSPCTTPNSGKFYLMANMSFDDAYVEPQSPNVEIQEDKTFPKISEADKAFAGDSVGLQEASVPLSSSTGKDNTEHEGDIGLHLPMKENEKTEKIKGVEKIEKLEKSEDFEGHSKLHSTNDNTKHVGVIKSDDIGDVKITSEPDHVDKGLDLTGKNDIPVTDVVAQKSSSKANSSTSLEPATKVNNSLSTKESSLTLGGSNIEDNTSKTKNERTINEGTGSGHVQTSTVHGDVGSQASIKGNEKTETIKEVIKSDSEIVVDTKNKSEPEHNVKELDLNKNINIQTRENVAENSPSKASSSASTETVTKESSLPIVRPEGSEHGPVQTSISQGDIGLQKSKENENTETIKGLEEVGKLERPKDELHISTDNSKPIEVTISDSKNIGDLKTKGEQEKVGKGLDLDGRCIIHDKKVEGENGPSKATASPEQPVTKESSSSLGHSTGEDKPSNNMNDRAINEGTEHRFAETSIIGSDIGSQKPLTESGKDKIIKGVEKNEKLESPTDVEIDSKLHHTTDNSVPVGVIKSDSGSVGQEKRTDNIDKGLDLTRDGNIQAKKVVTEIGPNEASSSTSSTPVTKEPSLPLVRPEGSEHGPLQTSISQGDIGLQKLKENEKNETIKGLEEVGKLKRPNDELHISTDNSKPVEVTKSDLKNIGDSKTKGELENAEIGLELDGSSDIQNRENVAETSPSKASSSALTKSVIKEPSLPLVRPEGSEHGLVQTSTSQGDIGLQKTKANEKTETIKGLEEIGKLEKPNDEPLNIDNSKPAEVTKSEPKNIGDLKTNGEKENVGKGLDLDGCSNIHDKKVVAENSPSKASASTSPGQPVMKELSFSLGHSIGEDKPNNDMYDRAINEGTGHGLAQISTTGSDIGSQKPTKENRKDEIIGVKRNEKLERSKDVEIDSNLHQTTDNSEAVGVIKSDSRSVGEEKRTEHIGKGLDLIGDGNIQAKKGPSEASSSTSSAPTSKDSFIPQVGTDNSLAKPIEPVKLAGIEPNPKPMIPEAVAVEQVVSQKPSKEIEQKDNVPQNSQAEKNIVGNSEGLQESSIGKGSTNNIINEEGIKEGSIGGLVQNSVGQGNQADGRTQTHTKENEKTEAKGTVGIEKPESSKDVKAQTKLDNKIDTSKSVEVIKSSQESSPVSEVNKVPDTGVVPEKI